MVVSNSATYKGVWMGSGAIVENAGVTGCDYSFNGINNENSL